MVGGIIACDLWVGKAAYRLKMTLNMTKQKRLPWSLTREMCVYSRLTLTAMNARLYKSPV